jgi:hypothetical protein
VITANEVPRDQRLPSANQHSQHSNRGSEVKKARRHKKSRASEGENRQSPKPSSIKPTGKSGPSPAAPGPLQRNPSSASSGGTRHSQLVDLVVENTEAEEEDRAQTQREYGTVHAEPEPHRFA